MRWPARIPAGTVCDELASTIDVLPTFAKLIDAELPPHKIDGKDIAPLIFGEPDAHSPHDTFCYYYANNELQAIRDRRWKLHFPHVYQSLYGRISRSDGLPIEYIQDRIQLALYDLKQDREERVNLCGQHPNVVERLQRAAESARADLGDALTERTGQGVRPVGKSTLGEPRFCSPASRASTKYDSPTNHGK